MCLRKPKGTAGCKGTESQPARAPRGQGWDNGSNKAEKIWNRRTSKYPQVHTDINDWTGEKHRKITSSRYSAMQRWNQTNERTRKSPLESHEIQGQISTRDRKKTAGQTYKETRSYLQSCKTNPQIPQVTKTVLTEIHKFFEWGWTRGGLTCNELSMGWGTQNFTGKKRGPPVLKQAGRVCLPMAMLGDSHSPPQRSAPMPTTSDPSPDTRWSGMLPNGDGHEKRKKPQ